jgi:hypothetical protein
MMIVADLPRLTFTFVASSGHGAASRRNIIDTRHVELAVSGTFEEARSGEALVAIVDVSRDARWDGVTVTVSNGAVSTPDSSSSSKTVPILAL